MASSVDYDETAHYEPSHQDLHCILHRYLIRSTKLKSLTSLDSREILFTGLFKCGAVLWSSIPV